MAVMKDVVSGFASVLGVPKPTVNMHYRILREAGLFVQSGRGRGASDVGPHDAAMLLLSLLHPGEIKNTGTITKNRYAAIFDGALKEHPKRSDRYLDSTPPFEVLRNSRAVPRTMGEVVAAAIEAKVQDNRLVCDKGKLVDVFNIEVNNIDNLHNIIIASRSSGTYRIKYLEETPDYSVYDIGVKKVVLKEDFAESIGHIETTKSINGITIMIVAAVLRGRCSREGEDIQRRENIDRSKA